MGLESDRFGIRPGGTEIPDGTTVYLHTETAPGVGNDFADPTTTDGVYEYQYDGCAGPTFSRVTIGTETRERHGLAVGLAGALSVGEMPEVLQGMGNGVLDSVANELQVTAPGGIGLKVRVRSGCGLARGVIYRQYTDNLDTPLTSAAHDTLGRIDTICIKAWPKGTAEEGRCELAWVEGTPNASPAAPALTCDDTICYTPLADISVPALATNLTTIATDRRVIVLEGATTPKAMMTIDRRSTGSTWNPVTTQSGQDIPDLAGTFNELESGVTYDLFGIAWVNTMPNDSANALEIAPYLNGTANIAEYVGAFTSPTDTDVAVAVVNFHVYAALVGTGAPNAISCGVRVRRRNNNSVPDYSNCSFLAVAIPRTT